MKMGETGDKKEATSFYSDAACTRQTSEESTTIT